MSVDPPGGKGTSKVTDFAAGQAWAPAVSAAKPSARAVKIFFHEQVSW